MIKKHVILDRPILGYFVLFALTMAFSLVGSSCIDTPLSKIIPGYAVKVAGVETNATSASGIGTAVAVIVFALIFTFWFRPDFKGVLGFKGFLQGLIAMIPFLITVYIGAAIDLYKFGAGNLLLAVLWSLAPGFSEEVAFRGLGIANYMRVIKSEKQIKTIFWISTLLFAFVHITNIVSGGNIVAVIFQVIYCLGVGAIFGAVYLRTANLWVTMIAHFTLDFSGYINNYYSSSGGLSVALIPSDYVNLVAAAIGIVTAMILISPKHYPEIMKVWEEKWSK